MPRSRKQCRECGHRAEDGWHISKMGWCRPCAVRRLEQVINAEFPPDPGSPRMPMKEDLAAAMEQAGQRLQQALSKLR